MICGMKQILRRGNRIVVEKINPFAARGFQGGIALDGGMLAARDNDFELAGRMIELLGGIDSFDVSLFRAGGDDDGDARHVFAHRQKLRAARKSSKRKVLDNMGMNLIETVVSSETTPPGCSRWYR